MLAEDSALYALPNPTPFEGAFPTLTPQNRQAKDNPSTAPTPTPTPTPIAIFVSISKVDSAAGALGAAGDGVNVGVEVVEGPSGIGVAEEDLEFVLVREWEGVRENVGGGVVVGVTVGVLVIETRSPVGEGDTVSDCNPGRDKRKRKRYGISVYNIKNYRKKMKWPPAVLAERRRP